MIFPEGTRSRDGRILPYKAGAVRIVAGDADLPLLPVAIDGTHVAPDLPGFARGMPGAGGTVTIGTPIPRHEWEGRLEDVVEEIRTWARERIETGRRDGSVVPPTGWSDIEQDMGAASPCPQPPTSDGYEDMMRSHDSVDEQGQGDTRASRDCGIRVALEREWQPSAR